MVNLLQKGSKFDEKLPKNQDKLSPIMDNNVHSVKKKHQFREFIGLIKSGKFTTALATARIIGVDRRTITSWLRSNRAKLALGEEVDSLVQKIKGADDWRSKAYLLDKLLEETENEPPKIQILEGLTIIRKS